MLRFLNRFWKVIAVIGGLVGVLFFVSDVQDAGEAIAAWDELISKITERHVLWAVSIGLALSSSWNVAQPWLSQRLKFVPKPKLMLRAEKAEAKLQAIAEAELAANAVPPDVDEGEAKNTAREQVRLLAIDVLPKAEWALLPYYTHARDTIKERLPRKEAQKKLTRVCDHMLGDTEGFATFTELSEIQSPDTMRKMKLDQVIDTYCKNYIRYMEKVELIYALIETAKPLISGRIDELRKLHSSWLEVHQQAREAQEKIGSEYPDLETIRTMGNNIKPDLVEAKWDELGSPRQ